MLCQCNGRVIIALKNVEIELLQPFTTKSCQFVEHRDTIRGSVTGGSLMMLDAGLTLRPECRYNKFVPDIPLYQTLVTTLDAIHRGYCLPNAQFIRNLSLVKEVQKRSQRLRTHLQHIRSLPHEVAQYSCERIHLNRLQQFWKPALNLAKILLRNKPIHLEDSVRGDGGYMWVVDTSKVWEGVLEQALKETFESSIKVRIESQQYTDQPWKNLGDRPSADIVVYAKDCTYIFDAKYKNSNGYNQESSKSEQYQMFAYSHLLDTEPSVHVGLIYPTFRSEPLPIKQYHRSDDIRCSLSLYYLPFPKSLDVRNKKSWDRTITIIGELMSNIFSTQRIEVSI